jgi:uncharacterized membrane protein YeaQ/YmgE (transglycosylase-associated protein family)
MPAVPKVHRLYLGIITGAFMFAAYFLLDMFISGQYPDIYETWFGSNQSYFFMFAFLVGIIGAQIYIWYYNKGLKKVRKIV